MLIGAVGFNELRYPYFRGDVVLAYVNKPSLWFEPYSDDSRALEEAKTRGAANAYEIPEVPGTTVYISSKVSDVDALKLIAKVAPEAERRMQAARWERRVDSAKWVFSVMLLPPVITLAIGALFRWALLGFRQE